MNPRAFADLIKSRRQELRIDQRTLASLAGVAVHTLSNVERGKGNPTLDVVSRLLDVLGLELVARPRTPETPP